MLPCCLLRYSRSGNEYLWRNGTGLILEQQLPRQTENIRLELAQWFAHKIKWRPRLNFARELRQRTELIQPASDLHELEWRRQDTAGPWGAALALDCIWHISKKFHVSFGQVIFDTEAPIYYYENDLPGIFTVPALRERGARRYIYLHLKAFGRASLSAKIAETEQQIAPAMPPRIRRSWGVQMDWTH